MSSVSAIAIVMAVVQFFKKLLPNIIRGTAARVLVILASIAVTLYKFLNEGLPLTFAAITFAVTVIVGALSAYSLVQVAGGNGR
jgi:uncharacterized membrane protein YfcA